MQTVLGEQGIEQECLAHGLALDRSELPPTIRRGVAGLPPPEGMSRVKASKIAYKPVSLALGE
ncbi:hypothetical protein [Streptomyces sp. NPDC001480]|uniref:hypothetical protein n=1 Tax=Streptomyces sp. NPDC001480 TaxID=3364577 RepID=UPI0036907F95